MSTLSARSVSRRLDRPGPIRPCCHAEDRNSTRRRTAGGPPVSICGDDPGRDQGFPTNRRPQSRRDSGGGWSAQWQTPALAGINVTLSPRLSRTLGRLVGRPWRIELGPRALVSERRLREVVTHEGAHAVLAMRAGPTHPAPHGPEWRELMALAGYTNATGAHWACHRGTGQSPQQKQQPTPRTQSAIAYDHWCPVCQSSRQARRPVNAWRCAGCVAAGLDGRLEITQRCQEAKDNPMTTPAQCPFCFPAEDRIAFEYRLTRALWDAFPVSEGHLLLVPRRHVPTWFDATAEEKAALTAAIDRGRELIASRHRPDGFNIGINVGKAAGQTVFHLHVHLIPRYDADVPDPRGGVRHVIPAKGNYQARADRDINANPLDR